MQRRVGGCPQPWERKTFCDTEHNHGHRHRETLLSSHLAMQRWFQESAVNTFRLGHTLDLLLLCTSSCCVRSLLISQQEEGLLVEL
jgi:hypothetical protein